MQLAVISSAILVLWCGRTVLWWNPLGKKIKGVHKAYWM